MTKFDDFLEISTTKKGKKWKLRFDPQIIAGNGENISKKLLVYVLDTLYMNWNKFFEKNKNDKIWRFLEIFTKIYKRLKTKKGKNDNCVLTIRLLSEMAKKIQKNFLCMF